MPERSKLLFKGETRSMVWISMPGKHVGTSGSHSDPFCHGAGAGRGRAAYEFPSTSGVVGKVLNPHE